MYTPGNARVPPRILVFGQMKAIVLFDVLCVANHIVHFADSGLVGYAKSFK